jgi:hypothetical protein
VSETLEEIADELVACRSDPELFVDTTFDWNAPELKGKSPEKWQRAVLQAIRDGLSLNKAVRIAVASGHGVGKTALTSWICLWAISTCRDARGNPHGQQRSAVANEKSGRAEKMVSIVEGETIFQFDCDGAAFC